MKRLAQLLPLDSDSFSRDRMRKKIFFICFNIALKRGDHPARL